MIEIKKDTENQEIYIYREGTLTLKIHWVPSYLCFTFFGDVTKNDPLVLSGREDKVFYKNLDWFMKQSYRFGQHYSYKRDNLLNWVSDCCYIIDIPNTLCISDYSMFKDTTDTPKLIIQKTPNSIIMGYSKPISKDTNGTVVGFSPAGNGQNVRNEVTNSTLQDDMVQVFNKTLRNQLIEPQKKYAYKPKE